MTRLLRSIALAISVLALLLLAIADPGTRLGIWGVPTGFALLRWGADAGVAGVALDLAALATIRPRGRPLGVLLAATLMASGAVLVPWRGLQRARAVPPIHDITTDTQDPPPFVAVLPLRVGAENRVTYAGERVARLQRAGYPDLHALHLPVAPPAAFGRALAIARTMGWDIVAADAGAGRLEGTATTPWFGFRDDVVVRLRREGAGTRVDVRSASRVGESDVGTNAARIRAFLGRLAAA